MPQLEPALPSHNEPVIGESVIGAKPDSLMCRTCQRAMAIQRVMPSTSMIGVDETIYVCDACGTETHRTARRP